MIWRSFIPFRFHILVEKIFVTIDMSALTGPRQNTGQQVGLISASSVLTQQTQQRMRDLELLDLRVHDLVNVEGKAQVSSSLNYLN